ncbi:MAG: hypothetical protein ACNS60_16055 [Candidatus Cyclobacteriaceae bacterium M2_1C_046]
MKKINLLIFLLLFTSFGIYGQATRGININEQDRKGNFMFGIAFDAIKTDFGDRVGNKIQGGLEVNYFLSQNFGVTGGAEAWSDTTVNYSGVVGVRFYPLKKIFLRARGLIGVNEISAGAGFSIFLNERWSAEGMLDAYTSGNVAARIGISYLLAKQKRHQPL